MIGALAWGAQSEGFLGTLADNIIAHVADPNNPSEVACQGLHPAQLQSTRTTITDDTIVYNWDAYFGPTDSNIEGLDTDVLDQTTIQNYAAALLGNPNATIEDLAEFLRSQASDGVSNDVIDADAIISYFQSGFGIAPDDTSGSTTATFVPSDLAEGVRWDNRLNWDSGEVPGSNPGDSADLGGNEVVYTGNDTIDTLHLSGGTLDVYGGRLTATGGIEGAGDLDLQEAGQAWIDGSDGAALDIDLMGGRFVNTGVMSGADLAATGGQAILASDNAEFEVEDGDTLTVSGAAEVGFDGENGGLAVLDLQDGAMVEFVGGEGDLGEIAEFRSGAFGDGPDVRSGIALDGTINIDLSGVSGTQFDLMSADEIAGIIDDATIDGLGGRNATITVDYTNDTVSLQLTSGSGNVSIETVGAEDDVSAGYQDLWNALTSGQGIVDDTPPSGTADDDLDDVAA